jgi:uncharacterized repeat protein (TIGR04042 family)
MPEIRFDIRWPDGTLERCYSPSLVVRELLPEGAKLPVFEFMERARAALNIGAERVRLKYGYSCSAALDQLAALEVRARLVDAQSMLEILAFHEGSYLPPLGMTEGDTEEKAQ